MATLNRIDFLACYGDTQVQVTARAADFWDARLEHGRLRLDPAHRHV